MIEYRDGTLMVGGQSAVAIAERYGTPAYVYDRSIIDRQIDRVLGAFQSMRIQPYYAMKANANLEILRILRARGFGCDAVSPGEVFLARKAGFEAERIWFTSTNLSDDDLRALRDPSIVINVDSVDSLERSIRMRLPNPVALRINPPIGAGHHPDVVTGGTGARFGLSNDELAECRSLVGRHGVSLVGLHAHVGSGVFDLDPLLESAGHLATLARDVPTLRWLNLGGGFGVPYRPVETEFPIERFANLLERIVGPLERERGIGLIVEPGRYLLAQSGLLLTTVTSMRKRDEITWLGCDTGFNHLVRPSRYAAYHHIVNASRGGAAWLATSAERPPADAIAGMVAGNLCESGDVFTRGPDGLESRALPATSVGDVIAFLDTGAYGFSMASEYNARLLPCEILVERVGSRVIRERGSLDDLLRGQASLG